MWYISERHKSNIIPEFIKKFAISNITEKADTQSFDLTLSHLLGFSEQGKRRRAAGGSLSRLARICRHQPFLPPGWAGGSKISTPAEGRNFRYHDMLTTSCDMKNHMKKSEVKSSACEVINVKFTSKSLERRGETYYTGFGFAPFLRPTQQTEVPARRH